MVKNNILMNKINKKVVQQMLAQASMQNPDDQPLQEDQDVKTNYNNLMKTLLLISVYLSDATLTIEKEYPNLNFNQFGTEYDDDSANPLSKDAFIRSRRGSDSIPSLASSVKSRGSIPDFIDIPRRRYNMPNYGRNIPEFDDVSVISGDDEEEDEEELQAYRRQLDNRNQPLRRPAIGVTFDLDRQAVNVEFYTNELLGSFRLLTKIQKQKLVKIIFKINNQINLIQNLYGDQPETQMSFKIIKESFRLINDELRITGEPNVTQADLYEYEGGSRYVMPKSRRYDPYNVNANFLYNLAKQND